jgi:integration host factor subunit beta
LEADSLTKKQIVRRLAGEMGVSQVLAYQMVQRTLDSISDSVIEHGRIELRNFGVFVVKRRAARQARNPRTNEPVRIPARNAIVFQASDALLERLYRRRPESAS